MYFGEYLLIASRDLCNIKQHNSYLRVEANHAPFLHHVRSISVIIRKAPLKQSTEMSLLGEIKLKAKASH